MGRSARNKIARHKRILEALQANAAVRVGELAEAMGVSGETIRRDLVELGSEGAVSRTYGGAIAKPVLHEPEWRERHGQFRVERQLIAERAIGLVSSGDVLMLETGSTIMHFAEALAKGESVTLVGFGTFAVGERAARVGRNPQTGAELKIPASKQPKFSAGSKLKDAVNK